MQRIPKNLDSLLSEFRANILANYLLGSRAYGTAREGSDEDYRGIFVLPRNVYLSIREPITQLSDEFNNVTYYTLKRFFELASSANPNIIEMLFMPPDCAVFESPLMRTILDSRDIFITKQAYFSHIRYALAQVKRAKGRNKWINNPQPERKPMELDFCRFVPRETPAGRFPYRPIPLRESGVDLSFCACASMEHLENAFRLYRYENVRRGVFRDGNIVCESIPKEDEDSRCIGLLLYNRSEHERALRDHANYWDWRKHRNEARWVSQERGEHDYDAKNMMHTFRLLLSGGNILKYGCPLVRFEGEELRLLLDIRDGKYRYGELEKMLDETLHELEESFTNSKLPESSDPDTIDALLQKTTEAWECEG